MPIKNSKIRDARPAITADAESEKGLFSANVSKGTVNIKRGTGRVVSFAAKYEEIEELRDLLAEIDELLTKNQYGTGDSLKDGYEAGSARTGQSSTAVQSQPAPAVVEGQVPSQSGVVSSATQGTGAAPVQAENTIEPELASGAEAQQAQAETPAAATVSQPVTPADPDNPFSA